MQHFLASRQTEDIPIKHLFVEYKHWIERTRPFSSMKEELATLARHGEEFRRIIDPKKGDPVYPIAVFLEAFDIRTAYPLLLALLDAKVDAAMWAAISNILEYTCYVVQSAL